MDSMSAQASSIIRAESINVIAPTISEDMLSKPQDSELPQNATIRLRTLGEVDGVMPATSSSHAILADS